MIGWPTEFVIGAALCGAAVGFVGGFYAAHGYWRRYYLRQLREFYVEDGD